MNQSIIRCITGFLICLGAALAGYSGWMLVSGEVFQASSAIKNESPPSDISGVSGDDWVWVWVCRWEFAKFIASDVVLGQVVEKLELNRPAKAGSSEKSIPAVCEQLRRRITMAPVNNTTFLKITVRDSSPERAAKIANTIAEVYRDTRLESIKRQGEAGIRTLEARLAQSLAEMKKASELLARLRDDLRVSYPEQAGWTNRLQLAMNALPDDRSRELRPFDEAKRDFEKAIQFEKILEQRLARKKLTKRFPDMGSSQS